MINSTQPSSLKTIIIAILFLLLGHTVLAQASTGAKNNESLLWKISGNGIAKPSYLFGTFHMLCKDDIHLSGNLKNALAESEYVFMEMDMDDPATMMGALQYMSMKDDLTLKDLYTTEEYNRVERYFKDSLKMGLEMFQTAKPFFLMAMLYPRLLECKDRSGVEQELMKLAKENAKEIRGLETMKYQMSVFDTIPYKWQAKELLKNIDSTQKMREEFNRLVSIYKSQSLDSLMTMLDASEYGGEEFSKILLDNRNKNWLVILNQAVKKEPVFVAVGAGHLPGKNGLIELLRGQGFTLTPVEN